MYKDFEDYGWDVGSYCQNYGVKEKQSQSQIIITTWQSIYKLPKKYFERFDVVVGDEAHQFKSKSLVNIRPSYTTKYRYVYRYFRRHTDAQMGVEGLFGPSYKIIATKELIRRDILHN